MRKVLLIYLCLAIQILCVGCQSNTPILSAEPNSNSVAINPEGWTKLGKKPNLFPVFDIKIGKYGYMDYNGNLIVPAIYDSTYPFSDFGTALVVNFDSTNSATIINAEGTMLLDIKYDTIEVDENTQTIKYTIDTNTKDIKDEFVTYEGCCDFQGNVLVSLSTKYNKLWYFSEERIFVKKDGKFMIVDKDGNIYKTLDKITRLGYKGEDRIAYSTDQYNNIKTFTGKWGYMDMDGNIIVEEQYSKVTKFSYGIAAVIQGTSEYLLIDKNGKTIAKYNNVEFGGYTVLNPISDGIIIGRSDGKYGAINSKGEWIIKPTFSFASINEGIISAYISSKPGEIVKYYYFDINGKKLLEEEYPCTKYENGHIFSIKNGRIVMLDIKGKTILTIPEGCIPVAANEIWYKWKSKSK